MKYLLICSSILLAIGCAKKAPKPEIINANIIEAQSDIKNTDEGKLDLTDVKRRPLIRMAGDEANEELLKRPFKLFPLHSFCFEDPLKGTPGDTVFNYKVGSLTTKTMHDKCEEVVVYKAKLTRLAGELDLRDPDYKSRCPDSIDLPSALPIVSLELDATGRFVAFTNNMYCSWTKFVPVDD